MYWGRSRLRSPRISTDEGRFRLVGCVAVGVSGCHRNVLPTDRGDSSPTAGLVERSADLVGDAFALVGAADRLERRHLVEELRDVGTRARRLGHRAGPAREHDEIEIDGAEPVAQEEWTVSLEMLFDDIEESTGPPFRAALDDARRRRIVASQTLRILPSHQLFLERVRQEGQPLIKLCALRRSD